MSGDPVKPFCSALPETMLFCSVSVPPATSMPPPNKATLLLTVVLLTISVAPETAMPPPRNEAELLEKVLSPTVSVPPLR